MKVPFNDLKREYDSIKNDIDTAIREVIDSSAFIKGPFLSAFEEEFAAYCDTQHCIGCSSGTTALHAALAGFGIGEGDEVITVSNTFIGTTEAITHARAGIVFVDINKYTYTMDPGQIEQVLTSRTKAILAVHLYGQLANMEALSEIAIEHDLVLIEDAAQAVGAELSGNKAGFYGDAACFSFYPGKNLGAYGDAGCVVTNNDEKAGKIRMLIDHGRKSKYVHEMEGYNYRLDALQAAVLSVKLKHIDSWNEKRRAIAEFYSEHLNKDIVDVPLETPESKHVYHIYCVRVPGRNRIQKELLNKGVATGVHYPVPLHFQPAYQHLEIKGGMLPVTEKYAGEILSLPIFPFMTQEETAYVVETLNRAVE